MNGDILITAISIIFAILGLTIVAINTAKVIVESWRELRGMFTNTKNKDG